MISYLLTYLFIKWSLADERTMQIGDNCLSNIHLPPEIGLPQIDGRDRVPPCRPPHANNTSFNSVSQWSPGRHGVLWSSGCCPPGRPPTLLTAKGWSSAAAGPRTLILSWPFVINVPSSLQNPKYRQSLVFRLFGSSISVYIAALSILPVFKAALDSKTYITAHAAWLGLILTVTS